MNPTQQFTDIECLIAEVKKPIVLFQEGMPFSFIPTGYTRESMEDLLPCPTRKRAAVKLTDSLSFINYTNKHGQSIPDACVIYANIDNVAQVAVLTAIINDNGTGPEKANWRDHTATFTPKKTVEWLRWNTQSGKPMDQLAFATWIEDNLQDIAAVEGLPTGTDMLKMAMEFEANSEKRFKQKLNVTNGGCRLEYVDDEDKDTRTQMSFFDRFSLGMRVFLNGPAYQVQARLRYRQKETKLSFWFELIRPDRVFEAALNDELSKIQSETGFLLLNGAHQ